jgi:hypothetical protein
VTGQRGDEEVTAMADGSAGAVLRALLELGPAPRSAIAKHAGISPATVTWQTRALLEAGLIVELPETAGASGIGRPHSPLALDTADNVAIAVHIAATHTTIAVVDIGAAADDEGATSYARPLRHPGHGRRRGVPGP